jgi:Hint domain
MSDVHHPVGIRRSRRNLIKIGAIASSAILASAQTKSAHAGRGGNGQGGNGQGGNSQGSSAHCFLRGTTIRIADGDRKIEDLTVGDLLPTVFGGTRPIEWIGRYLFKKSDPTMPWVKDVLPVRVARSALGPDVPYADLFVTRAHSLLIDDVLVPVCNLINDTTIAVYDARALDELEFFHIKLEAHDVIHAEGAPCETLLDVDESAINFAEYLRKYGPSPSQNAPCAPVFGYGTWIEIKSRLRSAISPWFDNRQKLDIIRDKLEEGEPLLRHSELVS